MVAIALYFVTYFKINMKDPESVQHNIDYS